MHSFIQIFDIMFIMFCSSKIWHWVLSVVYAYDPILVTGPRPSEPNGISLPVQRLCHLWSLGYSMAVQ